jgi:hypothetical protein
MEITPKLTVTRFAQLDPGDLFIVPNGDEALVAIVAEDPTQNGEKLMLTLGPNIPSRYKWTEPRTLRRHDRSVASKGIRAPASMSAWWMAGERACT